MLVIRLMRTGKKNQPFFKIIVTDKENPPRGGRFVEEVGFYNPLTKEKSIKGERVTYWMGKGAQPSDTVHNMLVKNGIIKEKKIAVHKKSKKQPEVKAEVKSVEVKSEEIKPEEAQKSTEPVKEDTKPEEVQKSTEPIKEPVKEEVKTEAPLSGAGENNPVK